VLPAVGLLPPVQPSARLSLLSTPELQLDCEAFHLYEERRCVCQKIVRWSSSQHCCVQALGDQLATEAVSFIDMLAKNAVMEFPFAPPGLPKILDGKAAIRKHVEALKDMLRIDSFSSPVVHRIHPGSYWSSPAQALARRRIAAHRTRSMFRSFRYRMVGLCVTATIGILCVFWRR
jgi:hypothetical protein